MITFVRFRKKIFRVIQFIEKRDEACAIIVPAFEGNWTEFQSDGISQLDHVYDAFSKKFIYCAKIFDLEVIDESDIPDDIKRDLKIKYLLHD